MTESDWHHCADPHEMLGFLRDSGGARERKLRRFASALARAVWPLLSDQERAAVAVAEQLADGLATRGGVRAVADAGSVVFRAAQPSAAYDPGDASWAAHPAVEAGANAGFPEAGHGGEDYFPAAPYRS